MRAGVALKPETPVSEIFHLLHPVLLVACVDVLAVQPGFGGQRFDSSVLGKVEELRSICPELDIQVNAPILILVSYSQNILNIICNGRVRGICGVFF